VSITALHWQIQQDHASMLYLCLCMSFCSPSCHCTSTCCIAHCILLVCRTHIWTKYLCARHTVWHFCSWLVRLCVPHVFLSSWHAWSCQQPTKCTKWLEKGATTLMDLQDMLTKSHLPPRKHRFVVHSLQSWLCLQDPQGLSCCWNDSGVSLTTSQSEFDMDVGHCCMTCVTVCCQNCANLRAGPTGRQSLLASQACIIWMTCQSLQRRGAWLRPSCKAALRYA